MLCDENCKTRMLLEQVIAELSEKNGVANRQPNCLDIRNSVAESSDSKISGVECNGKTISRTISRELNLHLESEREFFNRLHTRKEFADTNSECSSGGFPRACNISIPFEWEEKPGKPKNKISMQAPAMSLSLPPVRKSNLNISHLGDANSQSHLGATSPMPLSSRLRSILQPKLKLSGTSSGEISSEGKLVWDGNLHYPEEFAWRSMRAASPASVFEGPDCSPSSSSSLLSYCSRRPLSSSSKRHDSVSALLANRLIPVAEIVNAVPVENSGSLSQRILPAPIMSKNIHGSNMIRDSSPRLTDSNGGDPQKLDRVQSFEGRSCLNTLSRGDPSMALKSVRKSNSCRSVSWGGMESVSREEFMQPTKVLEVEKQVKQEDCQPIHVDKKVSNNVSAAASLVSTSVSDGINTSGSSARLSSGTSGSSGSSDPYIKSVHFGLQPSSRSDPNGLQGNPGLTRHSEKKRDFQDSIMEDNGRRTLIDSNRNISQRVKVRLKRWPLFMQQRMKMSGCCSSSASNTINCCSARTGTHTINHNRYRDKRSSLSNHQKIQVEWRKLHENDAIQKTTHVEAITAS